MLAGAGRCRANHRSKRGNGGQYAKARPREWGDVPFQYGSVRCDGCRECPLILPVAYRDPLGGRRFVGRCACYSKFYTPDFAIFTNLL